VIRSWTTIITAATYAAADQIVDFWGAATSFILRIAQISARFGAGPRRESMIGDMACASLPRAYLCAD